MRIIFFRLFWCLILALGVNGNRIDQRLSPHPAKNEGGKLGAGLADRSGVTTGAIKFYTWWWNEEDVEKGLLNKKSPPNVYLEMERWAYDDGEGGDVYPDKFDIILPVGNGTAESQTLRAEVTASFKLVSEEAITQMSEAEMLKAFSWTKEKVIDTENFTLEPAGRREIKIENYPLGEYLEPFYTSKRWPWFMKIKIVLKNSQNRPVGQGAERILEIVPGD